MRTVKLIAALLHYPSEQLQAHADELLAAVEQEAADRPGFAALVQEIKTHDLLDLQARYVETFDRGRACALHLFEHVHGEARDRGQAMVDLLEVYRKAGFEVALNELPDYLPLFLEFVSTRPEPEARQWLREVGHILRLLQARLAERDSPYAALFLPLLELAGVEPGAMAADLNQTPDDSPEALDAAWTEEPITFGLGEGCPSAQRPAVSPIQWGERRPARAKA